MNFKFLTKVFSALLFCTSSVANAGLIDNIALEKVNYSVNSGIYSWQTSYDIAFINQDLVIDVDIFLTGDDAGTSLKNIWEQGIEDLWSNAFDLFDGSYYYDTIFNIDWLNSSNGSDQTVTVHNGDGAVNLSNWYTGNPSGQGFNKQGRAAAHEFGHMIGLYDEYTGGALNPSGFIRNNSIMGSNLTSPQADHFDNFTDWVSLNSGSSPLSVVADSGSHYYQVSEPHTFAMLALAMVGLALRRSQKTI